MANVVTSQCSLCGKTCHWQYNCWGAIPPWSCPYSCWQIDFIRPLPSSAGTIHYALAIVHTCMSILYAHPNRHVTAEALLRGLTKTLFIPFGVPDITDEGIHFTSQNTQPWPLEPQPKTANLINHHTGLFKQILLRLQKQCGFLNDFTSCQWPSLN